MTTTKPAANLTPADFIDNRHMSLTPTATRFVLTTIQGIQYAINVDDGTAHTRPQFVQRYGRDNATVTLTPKPAFSL